MQYTRGVTDARREAQQVFSFSEKPEDELSSILFHSKVPMRAYAKTVFVASLLGVFMLLGCDSSTGPGSANPVAGTWTSTVSDSTLTMVFKSDSTFSTVLPNPAGTYYVTGAYHFTSTTITLTYASGLQGTEGIPPPSPTPVTGTLSGTKMTIPIPYNQNGDSTTLSKQN